MQDIQSKGMKNMKGMRNLTFDEKASNLKQNE